MRQPCNRNPVTGFALFDPSDSAIAFHRAACDVAAAARAIRTAGLPDSLADRLFERR
jgi:hypothetical protein